MRRRRNSIMDMAVSWVGVTSSECSRGRSPRCSWPAGRRLGHGPLGRLAVAVAVVALLQDETRSTSRRSARSWHRGAVRAGPGPHPAVVGLALLRHLERILQLPGQQRGPRLRKHQPVRHHQPTAPRLNRSRASVVLSLSQARYFSRIRPALVVGKVRAQRVG
jgi:hypothetical protein